jgi:hypothetical protein
VRLGWLALEEETMRALPALICIVALTYVAYGAEEEKHAATRGGQQAGREARFTKPLREPFRLR